GRELVEDTTMRLGHAPDLGSHGFRLGGVDCDAGATAAAREGKHVECPPRAGNDRGQAADVGLRASVRAKELLPRGSVEQPDPALHHLEGVASIDRARIGRIYEY